MCFFSDAEVRGVEINESVISRRDRERNIDTCRRNERVELDSISIVTFLTDGEGVFMHEPFTLIIIILSFNM